MNKKILVLIELAVLLTWLLIFAPEVQALGNEPCSRNCHIDQPTGYEQAQFQAHGYNSSLFIYAENGQVQVTCQSGHWFIDEVVDFQNPAYGYSIADSVVNELNSSLSLWANNYPVQMAYNYC